MKKPVKMWAVKWEGAYDESPGDRSAIFSDLEDAEEEAKKFNESPINLGKAEVVKMEVREV